MIPDAVDLKTCRRVLVIKLRHHGDVLLSSPVFSALRAAAPHLEIDALVYDDTASMLAQHPAVSQVHTVGRDWRDAGLWDRAGHETRLALALRARHYELLIHLTDHPRGAWLARWLGVRAASAPRRDGRWWAGSFTHRYPVLKNGTRHTVETHLDALRRIGVQPDAGARRLVLEPGRDAYARIDTLLAAKDLHAKRFIHLHPASRWQFKCWTARGNAELIDALTRNGHRVVLTGAPSADERAFVAEILKLARYAPIDLTGQLSLKELAALTARARLFVGVDSAPMHIAAAMGTPTVALFGPSGDIEWAPWQVPHRIVTSREHRCRPCGQDGCGGGKVSECLTTLSVKAVLGATDALLAETA